MNMLALIAICIALALTAGFCIAFEYLCRLPGPELADIRRWEAEHPHNDPADFDRWLAEMAEPARERLIRDTGELQKLYGHPYPRVRSDTGELRALAEAGDLGGVS